MQSDLLFFKSSNVMFVNDTNINTVKERLIESGGIDVPLTIVNYFFYCEMVILKLLLQPLMLNVLM